MTETTPPVHLRLRGKVDETTERLANRAALAAAHLLGLATGAHLRKLRGLNDPLADLEARLEEAELRARLAWEIVEMNAARFAKIPEKNRPYFAPAHRFRILEIKNLLAWNPHWADTLSKKESPRFPVCATPMPPLPIARTAGRRQPPQSRRRS